MHGGWILFARPGGVPPATDEALARIAQNYPDIPFTHLALGFVAADAGKNDLARSELQTVLQLDPMNQMATNKLTVMNKK